MVLRYSFTAILALASVVALARPSAADDAVGSISYPATPRIDATQTFFGTTVHDPYRWMERTRSDEVKQWVSAQMRLTSHVLSSIPQAEFFRSTIVHMRSKVDAAPEVGKYASVFLSKTGTLDVTRNGKTRVLFDVAERWKSPTSLYDLELSPDGLKLAYATETAGNGWVRWRALSTISGADIPGEVIGTRDWGALSWAQDSSGFYYGGYGSEKPRPDGIPIGKGFQARYHRLGTNQLEDVLVYERADRSDLLPYAIETFDGRYLVLGTASDGAPDANTLLVRDRLAKGRLVATIRPPGDSSYQFINNIGSEFYFLSTYNAPAGKVIALNLQDPTRTIDVIAQTSETLGSVTPIADRLIAHYFRDAASELIAFDYSGNILHRISLPGLGGTTDMVATRGSTGYFTFSSPTMPPTTYAYNASNNTTKAYTQRPSPFNTADYVTEELFAPSTGGVKVPVFVGHRRGLKLDGRTPTLIYGYGALGTFLQPIWQEFTAAWLARGGAVALACVRGGGEYGETWHRAGMLGNKQHSFDDFAAAAQLLINKGFASRQTLAAYGYSGGGLLVGVTEVQHPELFSAVAEEAGGVDVLRSYSYGGEAYWATEVGSPIASSQQFQWLYNYAPLVAIRKGRSYPATFVMTSENDANVSPAHAYKFSATLQWAQSSVKPVLLYVAPQMGHEDAQIAPVNVGVTEAFLWAYSSKST